MALIAKLERLAMESNRVHEPADCTYTIFEEAGRKFIQLDTYGSATRKMPGKKSQSIQFDEAGVADLLKILRENYPHS